MKRFVSTITKICKLRFCIHISSIRQASLSIFIKLSSDGAERGERWRLRAGVRVGEAEKTN